VYSVVVWLIAVEKSKHVGEKAKAGGKKSCPKKKQKGKFWYSYDISIFIKYSK